MGDMLHVRTQRRFSAHLMLQRAGRAALAAHDEHGLDELSSATIALGMAAFAVEAMCNDVGHRLTEVAEWQSFEWLSAGKKIRAAAELLELQVFEDRARGRRSTM